ncbi:Transcriptional regulator, Fis family [Candidatus Sulfopaludibacter sp. SbA3]|nr:Transcriptional regulator, Fis family [Candidatus Sulfopaludibacter sp. SbA3]
MKNEFDGLVEQLLKGNIFMQEAIELLEKRMIALALQANEGNQSATSKQLGIHRNTLLRKMRDYQLDTGRAHQRRKPVSREARGRKRKTA